MDEEQVVINRFWQQQEKYVYSLVGISVAAIGFVIVNTKGEPFSWSLIPAGLGVVSWGISIFCGLRFMQFTTSTLYANKGLIDVQKGNHPSVGRNPELMQAAALGIRDAIKENSKSVGRLGTGLNFFFYNGIVMYLIWHLIEMYFNT